MEGVGIESCMRLMFCCPIGGEVFYGLSWVDETGRSRCEEGKGKREK